MPCDEEFLHTLLDELKEYSGIKSKHHIKKIGDALAGAFPHKDHPNGDDTAAIKTPEGYQLFAAEGFLNAFVEQDPWFAGWCGLMVNISDIAAMGGYPTAVVNTLWGSEGERCEQILQGMVDASHAFRVPIVGGHTNMQSESHHLAVAIIGHAKKLLSSFAAQAGHALVCAVDLRGSYRKPFLNWNAATEAPPERLRGDLDLLPHIAEAGLAYAAKDISQAGILGTAIMLLESSQIGADINLENIPKPEKVSWHDWLRSFPSFGYLLTTPYEKLDELIHKFTLRDIRAAHIGHLTSKPEVHIHYQQQSELFWNIKETPLMDMT